MVCVSRKHTYHLHSCSYFLFRPDDLLATDGVSESNVLAYLAEIEKVRRYNAYSYASTLIHHAE